MCRRGRGSRTRSEPGGDELLRYRNAMAISLDLLMALGALVVSLITSGSCASPLTSAEEEILAMTRMPGPFIPCYHGCQCYNPGPQVTAPRSQSKGQLYSEQERFVVNCTFTDLHWDYRFKVNFAHLVQGLPRNTTDLILSNFMVSLEINTLFLPLVPQLLTFTLDSCRGIIIHSDTFRSLLFDFIRTIYIRKTSRISSVTILTY